VIDDTLDAGQVAPEDREWHGSGGQRKDRVFYYDHMKIFVREPGANAGYNLWLAPPASGEAEVYWWGGRQRTTEVVRPPVQVAGLVRGTSRSFEVAIPWTWMEAYPQPGDLFDVMFLFTDSDSPGADVAVKIASQQDRWIWWQGQLELTDTPEGLRPRPAPAATRRTAPVVAARKPPDLRVAEAIARSREAAATESLGADSSAASAAAALAASGRGPATAGRVATSASPSGSAASAAAIPGSGSAPGSGSVTGSRRARLNRQRLERRDGLMAPAYLRDIDRDVDLSVAQVDTFYAVLHRHLERIAEQRITSRIDFFVVDMASGAQCRRDQSRKYLVDLLARVAGTHDPTIVRWIAAAAATASVPEAAAAQFTREVALRAGDILAERGVATSSELIKRGRKASGLDEDEAYALLSALQGP
ncbi:MAG: hypothetical protein O2782_20105, partial [bacterium]|nr:hypothetical protein [bacterium]